MLGCHSWPESRESLEHCLSDQVNAALNNQSLKSSLNRLTSESLIGARPVFEIASGADKDFFTDGNMF
jgi:hypothetical protein